MSFHRGQFLDAVERTLTSARLGVSRSAVMLQAGICAQESQFGHYIRQLKNGPARGIFQMEPRTEADIWQWVIRPQPDLRSRLVGVCGVDGPDPDALELNLQYQILMCRIFFLRFSEPLPVPTPWFLSRYWKKYWNTEHGAGTEEEFVENFYRYVVG